MKTLRSVGPVLLVACGGTQPAQPARSAGTHGEEHRAHHHHDGAQPLGHRFEQADRWVNVFDDPARDAWQMPDKVVSALELKPGMTVADIGAGTGYFESRLSSAVGPAGKVLAIDVEPDMVRYLGERATREKLTNVEAKLATPADPALPPDVMDRILIVDTWHHIPDRAAYAKRLFDSLRPGGFVLVVDYTMQASKGPPRKHRIEPSTVTEELEHGGFKIVDVMEVGLPDQYVIRAERHRLTL